MLAAIDPENSWERFLVALESDVGDVQGGTTKEGIHMGVMAGTLDLIQRAYAGSEIRDGVLYFEPRLPERLEGLSFPMQFRRTPIRVTLDDGELSWPFISEGVARPDQGRGRRRRPRARRRRPVHVRASRGERGRPSAENYELKGGAHAADSRERSSTSTACSSTRRTRRHGASRCAS